MSKTPKNEPSLANPIIYKIKQMVNGSVKNIFVYNSIYIENKDDIFTSEENQIIKQNKIKPFFSNQFIHFDDTIGTIKIKILNDIKFEQRKEYALEELYLYCQKEETLNAVNVFDSLTQNKKIKLTKLRLDQFISNIVMDEAGNAIQLPPDKADYTFDDIFQMKFNDKKYIINKVLGQKFFIVENEYPFIVNPYDVNKYDDFFEKAARKSLTTLNNHLLLNSGNIIDREDRNINTVSIYLCLADDVLSYLNKKNVSETTTMKIYYPFLSNANINSLDDLDSNREKLIEANTKFINKKTFDMFNTVDMFYDLYYLSNKTPTDKKTKLEYKSQGIKFIRAVIKPDFDIKIPLDIIFKIVHATKECPLIKHNPSSRQENIYRLYTDNISTDGRNIPYLNKATIFRLIKSIARNKSVSVYIETTDNLYTSFIICEFDEYGYITITSDFKNAISILEIDNIFREFINPLIVEIKNVLEQSGYKINKFHSLNDENVEVKQLTYESEIKLTKKLNIEAYKGCYSSVFINETNTFKNNSNISLRFKRVSNYSKFTSQEAFVMEKKEQGFSAQEIIEELLDNFADDLDRNQAEELVRKLVNEIEVERGVRKTDIKIKNSPGFKTTIVLDKGSGIITITTENINNINYLYTLPIYLDTIVRLTQDKLPASYDKTKIKKICQNGTSEDILLPNLISPLEQSSAKSEVSSIDPYEENVQYMKADSSDTNKPKGAYDLLFDDDDDDEDEDDEKEGGAKPKNKVDSDEDLENDLNNDLENEENDLENDQDDEDEDDEDDDEDDEEDDNFKNIDNMKLNKPYYFQTLIEKKDPKLILREDTPQFNSYVRTCSSSMRKQPVILSDSQLKKIHKDHPGFLREEDVIKYGSDPKNQNNYICPRYWCLKTNTIVNPTELQEVVGKDGKKELFHPKCGKVLPKGEKTVKPGYYIYEFYKPEIQNANAYKKYFDDLNKNGFITYDDLINILIEVLMPNRDKKVNKSKHEVVLYKKFSNGDKTGEQKMREVFSYEAGKNKDNKDKINYEQLTNIVTPKKYPGLIPDSHPDGLCLPCCFDKYNTEGRVGAMEKCNNTKKDNKTGKDKVVKNKAVKNVDNDNGDNDNDNNLDNQNGDNVDNDNVDNDNDNIDNVENIANDIEMDNTDIKNKETYKNKKEDEYVKGPDKFPLEQGRWGYLPVEIQSMMHESNADCQISKTNTNIKDNYPCLLRHGVEINRNQSFIACLSDMLFYAKRHVDENNKVTDKFAQILSIKEMKERIIQSLTIDSFIKYQNGNLVTNFSDMNSRVNYDKYKDSVLFSKLDMNVATDKAYYTKVISAFENFKNYLEDDATIIDHTYLWDIVSMPNKYLFKNGVNLVIFHLPKDDITNNVHLLCPTNHYSSTFYESKKPTVFLVKEDNYYEPIYSYKKTKKILVIKEFKEGDPNLSATMSAVFKNIIKPFFNLTCRPLDSMPNDGSMPMPNIYTFKRPILLYNLVQKLDKYKYQIEKLVMNFNNKIIGIMAKEPKGELLTGFIPCYPSAINETLKKDIDYVFMTDLSLWNEYKETVQFLNRLDKRSKKRREESDIPCKPIFKVIEDELVVGILTVTNQFIQLSKPICEDEIREKDLPILDDFKYNTSFVSNLDSFKPLKVDSKNDKQKCEVKNSQTNKKHQLLATDSIITTQNDVDHERVDYIKRIRLETSFYNVFRNTIRVLINDYEHFTVRAEIEKELNNIQTVYTEKLKNVNKLLRDLASKRIKFEGDKNFYKLINEVSTCLVKDENSCGSTPNLCAYTNNKCDLILPEKNLITQKDNETIYYGRMSDELIRYSRIKTFMFQPQTYLSFSNIGYDLRDNEIIMIESLLTQQFFETLVPSITNKYIKHNSYDEVQPLITHPYDNVVESLDHAVGVANEPICNITVKPHITSSEWKSCFPGKYKEVVYSKHNFCTFKFFIDLLDKKSGEKITKNKVKNVLLEEYKKYLEKHKKKIVDILILEGKKTLGDQVLANDALSFNNFIYTDNYFLTAFDLWLLVTKYDIPTIFICQKPIKFLFHTKYKSNIFVANGKKSDEFAFIVLPGFRTEVVPGYTLVTDEDDNPFISLNKLIDCNEKINEAFKVKDELNIEQFLTEFVKPKTTEYIPQNNKKLRIQRDPTEVIVKKEHNYVRNSPNPEEKLYQPGKPTKKNKLAIAQEKKNVTKRGRYLIGDTKK
jgi:hypothetical protein